MNLAAFQATLAALQSVNQVGATAAGFLSERRTATALDQYGQSLYEDSLREGRALLGAQRVAFAKSGVDPGTGTPLDIQRRQRVSNQLQAMRSRYGPQLTEFRLKQQSALETGTGLTAAATTLGKGILDYYQNKAPTPTTRFKLGGSQRPGIYGP